jgi:hypothetical protein
MACAARSVDLPDPLAREVSNSSTGVRLRADERNAVLPTREPGLSGTSLRLALGSEYTIEVFELPKK